MTADSDTSERGLEVTDEDSDETPVLTGSTPVITGTYQVGSTLVVEPGAWEPAEVELSYRWLRDGQVIPWATGDSFSLQAVDEYRDITVEVTGNFGTSQVTKTSTPVTVEPGTLTIGMPKIPATPMGGETLSVDPGEWGPEPSTSSTSGTGTDLPLGLLRTVPTNYLLRASVPTQWR